MPNITTRGRIRHDWSNASLPGPTNRKLVQNDFQYQNGRGEAFFGCPLSRKMLEAFSISVLHCMFVLFTKNISRNGGEAHMETCRIVEEKSSPS